jgi:elongation factor P
VHDKIQWLAQNAPVEVVTNEEKPVTVEIPVKVDLEVKEAPPGVKGDTTTGGNKLVMLSTGAKVDVPLFINTGDVIRMNTDTGEYVERVNKA